MTFNYKISFAKTSKTLEEAIEITQKGLFFNNLTKIQEVSTNNIQVFNNNLLLIEDLELKKEQECLSITILENPFVYEQKEITIIAISTGKEISKNFIELVKNSYDTILSLKTEKEVKEFITSQKQVINKKPDTIKQPQPENESKFDFSQKVIVGDHIGLHARPAATLSKTLKNYQADVFIIYKEKEYNCKSIGMLMSAGIPGHAEIILAANGIQAKDAVIEGCKIISYVPETTENQQVSNEYEYPTFKHSGKALIGIPASPGIGLGKVFILDSQNKEPKLFTQPRDTSSIDMELEFNKIKNAIKDATKSLEDLVKSMEKENNVSTSKIFEAHIGLLNDEKILEDVKIHINRGHTAEYAWLKVLDLKIAEITAHENSVFAERAADYKDLKLKVHEIITGETIQIAKYPDSEFILISNDLTPSQTAKLPKDKVIAIATSEGGPTAHSAILSRALGIPAIVGVGKALKCLKSNQEVALNGHDGFLEPQITDQIKDKVKEVQKKIEEITKAQDATKFKPAVTKDGFKIEIGANVATVEEIETSLNSGAESMGLLRTEFVFQEFQEMPTEEEQLEVFAKMAKKLDGKKVIIRTFDIGADKPVPFLDMPKEENPFLGERGIRLTLNEPLLFNSQINAIVRAVAEHKMNAKIMFPMVSVPSEIIRAKEIVEKAIKKFNAPKIEIGIMLEVPSAVIMCDVLAQYVDFFSIGTNDLTQYVMAIDRQHPKLSKMASPLEPSVLRFIDLAVKSAHKHNKWIGICGNMAANPVNARILIGLGLDELSMGAASIPAIKDIVRNVEYESLKELAQKSLQCKTSNEVRNLFTKR